MKWIPETQPVAVCKDGQFDYRGNLWIKQCSQTAFPFLDKKLPIELLCGELKSFRSNNINLDIYIRVCVFSNVGRGVKTRKKNQFHPLSGIWLPVL